MAGPPRRIFRDIGGVDLTDSNGLSGRVIWDDTAKSLGIEYTNQQQQQGSTTLPRGEDKILGQNIACGIPVTIAGGTVLGGAFLPNCILGSLSTAYVFFNSPNPASLSITLLPAGAQNVVAEFTTGITQGIQTIVLPIVVYQTPISSGWYDIMVGMSDQAASALIYGIRIVADPTV